MRRDIRVGVLAVMLMACSMNAAAQRNPAGTPAEQAQLPPFCEVKLKDNNRSPEAQQLIAQFGFDNWLHLHHYCYGRVFLLRASMATAKRDQDYQRSLAAKEYSYVLRATKPDFWMRPQLNLELGRIHQALGQREQAMSLFSEAVRANRLYLPAYLALIAALRADNQRSAALEVAEEGLRNLPDSGELKKIYFDLGGKEPLPRPAEAATRNSPTAGGNVRPQSQDPAARSSEMPLDGPGQYDEPAAPAQQSSSDDAAPASPQTQGRTCRFCPPAEIEERWRESFQK